MPVAQMRKRQLAQIGKFNGKCNGDFVFDTSAAVWGSISATIR